MAAANYVMNDDEISVITWDKLREVAEEDSVMVKLLEIVMRGFPQSCYDLDETVRQFHKFRHDLHVAWWRGVLQGQDRGPSPAETADARGNTRSPPRGHWHGRQGGGHSVLAQHNP